jgi:hypothetical protein
LASAVTSIDCPSGDRGRHHDRGSLTRQCAAVRGVIQWLDC